VPQSDWWGLGSRPSWVALCQITSAPFGLLI